MLYEEQRPAVAAKAVGFALGDTVAELITPTGVGPIAQYLIRYGDGIRSTVFSVGDLGRTKRYFADRGITIQPGDAPETIGVPPEGNLGLLLWSHLTGCFVGPVRHRPGGDPALIANSDCRPVGQRQCVY